MFAFASLPVTHSNESGVFATRAPIRPNPPAISVVCLRGRDGASLHVEDVDILDGTPLLDIKPYIRNSTTTLWTE